MAALIDRLLKRYGCDLTLVVSYNETYSFRGLLQHFDSHTWANMQKEYSLLGDIPRGRYVLLVPMEPELEVGSILMQGEKRLILRRIETVRLGDKALYRWGLCAERTKEATW